MAETQLVKRADKAPISTHPAFPAIVALWFAGLLGLGSLVLPIALFERLVALTGVATLVPWAEPPLGFTARVTIALAGAIGGAAGGLLLARQVARSSAPRVKPHRSAPAEGGERRPISAHDELGEEGLGWTDPASTRPEEHVEDDLPIHDEIVREGQQFHSPDYLDEPAEPDICESGADLVEAPDPQLSPMEASPAEGDSYQTIDQRPLDELGLVQLAGRLGAAIEKRRAHKARGRAAASASPAPAAPADFNVAEPEDAARAIASFFASRESAERSASPEEESATERPQPPASMRALHLDEDEDDADALLGMLSVPPRSLAAGHRLPEREAFDQEDPSDEDEIDESGYSSLLAMKNPFTRHEDFVRGDEPAAQMPGFKPFDSVPAESRTEPDEAPAAPIQEHAAKPGWPLGVAEKSTDLAAPEDLPGDRAEAERGLRAALATLQRMNGAA